MNGHCGAVRHTHPRTHPPTRMDVMASLALPSVSVSPLAQSMPNTATMSPAAAELMSSISLACMRTRRGTRTWWAGHVY